MGVRRRKWVMALMRSWSKVMKKLVACVFVFLCFFSLSCLFPLCSWIAG